MTDLQTRLARYAEWYNVSMDITSSVKDSTHARDQLEYRMPEIIADLLESRREVERLQRELDSLNDVLDNYEKNSGELT